MNLKQGKISDKEYALKFTKLFFYASELLYSVRFRMWKFTLDLSQDFVLVF